MERLEEYSILIARIEYADGSGSKSRPAMVIEFNDEVIKTYRLTTKYENKSDKIKAKYFEIMIGLKIILQQLTYPNPIH